ncbi:MAG: response regulator [Bacteroidales bacterium]|nr:response regulator [Bacteroidales bacterium]
MPLSLRHSRIQIKIYKLKNFLHFEVQDTGIGISKEDIEKVFNKFVQIESSAERKYKGTGLGLAIVKELVQLLNGKIEMESEPGKGTVVKFAIPFQPFKSVPTNIIELENKPVPEIKEPGKKQVLVIEDNKETQYYYQNYISDASYQLIFAQDGLEGKKMALGLLPDLIILDIKLPKITGYEILRQLKYHKEACKIPVIIITETDARPNLAVYNYKKLINKPVEANKLKSAILDILATQASIKQLVILCIISDSLKVLDYYKTLLRSDSIIVVTVQETRKSYRTVHELCPNFVVVDENNLSVDCNQLLDIMLSNDSCKGTQVVVISSNQQLALRHEALVLNNRSSDLKKLIDTVNLHVSEKLNQVKVFKLMIVEDDPVGLLTLKTVLEDKYNLIEARNGNSAVELYREHNADLVLMDIIMPDPDGFKTFDKIRKLNPAVPIVAITAKTLEQEKKEIFEYGFTDYIAKPYDANMLLETIGKYLKE